MNPLFYVVQFTVYCSLTKCGASHCIYTDFKLPHCFSCHNPEMPVSWSVMCPSHFKSKPSILLHSAVIIIS